MSDVNKKYEAGDCDPKVAGHDFQVSGWGHRHQQCLILLVTVTSAYSMRACMGVALVGMVEKTQEHAGGTMDVTENNISASYHIGYNKTRIVSNITNFTEKYEIDNNNNGNVTDDDVINVSGDDYKPNGIFNALMLTPPYPQFKWSKKTQDMVISSFFFGYMLLQVPGGQLAHRFGSKTLLIAAMGINCVVSLLFPLLSYYGGWKLAAACRMIQGLSQACIFPSIHTLLGQWTPLEERGRMASIVYGGQALGPVLGLPITGFIAASSMGWPGIFRFYGILAGIMGCVMVWTCADTPAKHPKISAAERQYIEEALGKTSEGGQKRPAIPWSRLLRSRGLWGIVIAHIGQTWGQLTLYSEVPAFMDKVMGVNIKANGLLTALPFLVMWFTNFFFSWFFDMMIVKKYLSVTWARKTAQSVGCIPASLGLIVLAYAPKNIYVVEIILIVICGFKISSHVGFLVNHIDVAPNFAGTMMSISNFVSNSIGFLAPIVAGIILTDDTSEYLWRKVFFVSSGFYFFSNLIYVLIGTCELADWNNSKPALKDEDKEEARSMLEKK